MKSTPEPTQGERVCQKCGGKVLASERLTLLCSQCHSSAPSPVSENDRIANFIARHKKTLKGLAKK